MSGIDHLNLSDPTLEDIESVARSMPGGFFIYRADEREELVYANDVLPGIFGCETMAELRELTGFTFPGMVHPDDLDTVHAAITSQVSEDEEKLDYVEYRILRRDGSVRWVDDYGRLVHTRDHGDMYFVFIRDVTEKRQLQAEQLRMELELERERQVNEAKSAFLFNISHDIRTPMNAIMGFTDLALRHMDDPDRLRDYLGKVAESNRHMMSLIDDLLEMSQIDAGRVRLRPEICDLREQLTLVLDIFSAQAEEKRLSMEADIDLPEGEVTVDAHRFRRIMTNLIGNAVKFTPAGGSVRITARAAQVSESGFARYEFKISDTGVGMTKEFLSRIFGAFERETTSTKSGYAGTGLGLSIVKSLLDVMGGSIAVESKKGEGSTFTVSLPLKLADYAAAPEPVPADETPLSNGEHRILLVEDIEINRLLAETILEDAGFLVESVPDGCDAVEAVRNSPLWYYDLVLMDIQMPVMNGYEATRAIRAIGREDTLSLPIIALSANAREEDKRQSLESGMNSHVAKPFDVAKLIATVNEHIEARERP